MDGWTWYLLKITGSLKYKLPCFMVHSVADGITLTRLPPWGTIRSRLTHRCMFTWIEMRNGSYIYRPMCTLQSLWCCNKIPFMVEITITMRISKYIIKIRTKYVIVTLDFLPLTLKVGCFMPLSALCQFSSKSVHLSSKYRVHKFGKGLTDGRTDRQTDRQIENIMLPASLCLVET